MDIRLRSAVKINLRVAGGVVIFKMFMYTNMMLTTPQTQIELIQLCVATIWKQSVFTITRTRPYQCVQYCCSFPKTASFSLKIGRL